jgi:[Skp1-protein]-hydroxyproline N-acetylglucosaminyltransferase
MTTLEAKPRRRKAGGSSGGPGSGVPSTVYVFCFIFVVLLYFSTHTGTDPPGGSGAEPSEANGNANPASPHMFQYNVSYVRQGISEAVKLKRQQITAALQHLNSGNLPARLRSLRDKHQIVGEHLGKIKAGTETVQELLHGHDLSHHASDRPPMAVDEIIAYLDSWIHTLHETLSHYKHATFDEIWQAYHDLTVKTLYPWDQDYLSRMPPRRNDGSIFLSIATYRDENCFNTMYNAYGKAKDPEKLFVGLVQQNCHENCKSGVLENLKMEPVPPDDDCYELFCNSDVGKAVCARKQVRVLNIDEPESLGPYAARYFASKLWSGEEWYMQIDAHMTFAEHWDATSVAMLKKAPSQKPILSHYPPSHTIDLDKGKDNPGARLCGPIFATSDLEAQIVRLEGGGWDHNKLEYPGFAPFTAAGYFVAHSSFLKEVPFDPFLPWIFMGEEIIMSSRLWTAGYDIFNPNTSVVGHIYVRRHKPKFWESVHRAFTMGVSFFGVAASVLPIRVRVCVHSQPILSFSLSSLW